MHYGIAIELRADCQQCGQPVHVNALVEEIKCKGCHHSLRLAWDEWESLLEDAFDEIPDYELGRGGRSQSLGGHANTNILYVHFNPYCFDCKTDFDMDEVAASNADSVNCKQCSKSWHVRRASQEVRSHLPGVELLLAEDEKLLPGDEAHVGNAPNASKPIVFQCPSCSGALRVDGSERVIDCEYCSASVYLPDDLWHRLHPRDTIRRWFLWWKTDRVRDASRFPVEEDSSESSAPATPPVPSQPPAARAVEPPKIPEPSLLPEVVEAAPVARQTGSSGTVVTVVAIGALLLALGALLLLM